MSKMKISGPTQGKLVFAYDIREGHIDYKSLLPALNRRIIEDQIEAVVEEKELEEIIGEVLYRVNEKIFESFHDYLLTKKMDINFEEVLKDAIGVAVKK